MVFIVVNRGGRMGHGRGKTANIAGLCRPGNSQNFPRWHPVTSEQKNTLGRAWKAWASLASSLDRGLYGVLTLMVAVLLKMVLGTPLK
jgi:hypothetical protein